MSKKYPISVLVVVLAVALAAMNPLQADPPADVVQKAYESRMRGNADEAKALLEQELSKNPGNAAARCELARTLCYLAVGNPQRLKECIDAAQSSIEKAMRQDPSNAAYAICEGNIAFFHAYMALHEGGAGTKEKFGKVCRAFESATKARPLYLTPLLYLVEIYGVLPEENGGDKAKAEEYAGKLVKLDAVFGAKANSILLPEDADTVAYWKKVLEEHKGNADVLEELGKSCLYNERFEEGVKYIEEAIEADANKKILLLDLARFHLMRVMKGSGPKKENLAAAENAAKRYLKTEPIQPLKAYTLEILAKVKFGMDDKKAVTELREEAAKIDPNYSKAFAIPGQALFIPPDAVPTEHRYLFRPF